MNNDVIKDDCTENRNWDCDHNIVCIISHLFVKSFKHYKQLGDIDKIWHKNEMLNNIIAVCHSYLVSYESDI